MAFFVILSLEQRKHLFNRIKVRVGLWGNFYPKYNISKSMFFNYLSGRYNLPLKLFDIWKKLAGFKEEVKIIEKTTQLNNEQRNIQHYQNNILNSMKTISLYNSEIEGLKGFKLNSLETFKDKFKELEGLKCIKRIELKK